MPIYLGTTKLMDDQTAQANYKWKFGTANDYMWQKRVGGLATDASYTVESHFEGWCCYVGYGGGGFGGTIVCGEDRTDMTVTPSGATQGYSMSKSGGQGSLVVTAGSTNAIANIGFVGFVMRF